METAAQPRLPRAERREQIVAAATRAFATEGFAATGLDEIAAEAGISRAILYRHFESKTDLYRAVLDRVCERLGAAVGERPGGFTDAAVDGLIAGAAADPDGFRLLFQHVPREPEFRDFADRFGTGMTAAAHQQIAALVPDPAWARWAAKLAPVVAIEAVIAWLDAGRPDIDAAADRVRGAIGGVVSAAQHRPEPTEA
ncbi:TetR/AcrR family transcriptional regulator [Jiangella alkaliphila]|uniref:DNA-binding transcriptional regulator, AcrR family n=1 Tax=Jiangella alkaliphila TaxID=419479 RepID=A0A1H2H0G4_9ACTN|nr:TetR/AcrR family transcriptional regulator [Jiangella alkaliphila]SDU25229.1 DNA-binding transcriptional regulator, AcrR family [Jiangella alkaliphila]